MIKINNILLYFINNFILKCYIILYSYMIEIKTDKNIIDCKITNYHSINQVYFELVNYTNLLSSMGLCTIQMLI